MGDVTDGPVRGPSSSSIREFTCKDCQRELDGLRKELAKANQRNDSKEVARVTALISAREGAASRYNEHWAKSILERGGSRSDRCKDHRAKHKVNIQGMAVAYIDIRTVGEVADRQSPKGPLGGLGPLPDKHVEVPNTSYDLMEANVGMTDAHALEMIRLLRNKRVLVLKAGTGTGKSTFGPYRLMDPPAESYENVPAGAPFAKLTDLGQIVVTEPRVQAARGVAGYVGGTLSGAGGVGPGFPVGYQVAGDRNHDEACQLVYVTDGTMINWLREGRLSRIGTVIVDEAHERSVNIDFIMGYLKRELDRYPHLRVIITSATFDAQFYQEYFGGPEVAHVMHVLAVKSFGYGMPLFPELDGIADGEADLVATWLDPELPLSGREAARNDEDFIREHWKEQFAPPLPPDDVKNGHEGPPENVWDTTRELMKMRFTGKLDMDSWSDDMPDAMAKFVIQLAENLDEADIFGDILGFLPTTRQIEDVVDQIQRALGPKYQGHVLPLISSLTQKQQDNALAKRRKGDPRKIVISTNLAETSLTVEGVRFVVDSGVIAQSEWDPNIAQGGVRKKLHSQSGIRQRWGRVGRKAPGWVFPLYTKGQFLTLDQDTPPGSTRENLEALVMTARMGGVDDVAGFPWPASFEPTEPTLEASAIESQGIFKTELKRADAALRAGGAVDAEGHPTAFGREITRFSGLGTSNAMAVLYADRLGCVPEVATVISLLGENRLVGNDSLLLDTFEWPDEWRLEAAGRHRALAGLAEDEAHLALLIMAAWERQDPGVPAWEPSSKRALWAARWWVNDAVLLAATVRRQEILAALSPAMKEEVKRFVEPALLDRTRGILTRALQAQIYDTDSTGLFTARMPVEDQSTRAESVADEAAETVPAVDPTLSARAWLEERALVRPAGAVIALRRRTDRTTKETRLSGTVLTAEWALEEGEQSTGGADAMRLLVRGAMHAPPDPSRNAALGLILAWPAGTRALVRVEDGHLVEFSQAINPFALPEKKEGTAKNRKRRRKVVDEDGGAASADAAGDLKGSRQGEPDEDQLDRAAFARADRQAVDDRACRECFACRDGRPEDCDDLADATDSSRGGRNPLQGWQAKTAIVEDSVKQPKVTGIADTAEPQWVEITGLAIVDGVPTVSVIDDWRPDGFRGNPAQHADLQPGDFIEVVVGPLLEDHGGTVRSFLRKDGKGRFVLREATNPRKDVQESRREIGASLDRSVRGLLEGLVEGRQITATVVPARFDGCLTVTPLEFLFQHLGKTVPGVSTAVHKFNRRESTTMPVAEVVEAVNEWGYVHFALLHHDSVHGIRHRFRLRVSKPAGDKAPDDAKESTEASAEASAASELTVGRIVLLNLVRDYAELNVSDLPLAALEAIEKNSAGTITLVNPKDRSRGAKGSKPDDQLADEPDDDAAHDESGGDGETTDRKRRPKLAPSGTELRTTKDKPLSRAAAAKLVKLSDEDDWANEVWSFWARSHHQRLDQKTPFVLDPDLPALDDRTRAMLDVTGVVTIVEENPLEVIQRGMAEFAERAVVGTPVEVTVERLVSKGAIVTTAEGLSAFIPSEELSWKKVKNAALYVAAGDRIHVMLTEIEQERNEFTFSLRAAQDAAYRQVKAAVADGTTVDAFVAATSANVVYLTLHGATAEIRVEDLSYEPPESAKDVYEVDARVTAAVKRFNDDLRIVELSVKALSTDPYVAFAKAKPEGSLLHVTVLSATKGALQLKLAEGVRGYLVGRDFASYRVEDLSEAVDPGEVLRACILKHNGDKSEAQLSTHPFDLAKASLHKGDTIQGTVQGTTKGTVVVQLSGGVTGIVRRGDFSHDPPDDLSTAVTIGQPVSAKILEIDASKREVRLSTKALLPPPYQAFKDSHRRGEVISAEVARTIQSFVFVKLAGGADGKIHVSDLAARRVGHPDEIVNIGQTIRVAIVDFEDDRRQVKLSLRAVPTGAAPQPVQTAPVRAAPVRSAPVTPPRQTIHQAAAAPKRTATREGISVESAVDTACRALGLPKTKVRVEVLDDGARGLFGRVKRPAKVRVTEL